MVKKQVTLREDLLNRGVKRKFYFDANSSLLKRAYEVLDLSKDSSSSFSTGVDMLVNLYIEGGKKPQRVSLSLTSQLNDLRITRRQCYDILQPLEVRERRLK